MVLSVRPNLGSCGGELGSLLGAGHASGSPAERQTPESQEAPQPILRHLLGIPSSHRTEATSHRGHRSPGDPCLSGTTIIAGPGPLLQASTEEMNRVAVLRKVPAADRGLCCCVAGDMQDPPPHTQCPFTRSCPHR